MAKIKIRPLDDRVVIRRVAVFGKGKASAWYSSRRG